LSLTERAVLNHQSSVDPTSRCHGGHGFGRGSGVAVPATESKGVTKLIF